MTQYFVDSFYWFALANPKDSAHERALAFAAMAIPLLTTAWVLTEVGDGLCRGPNRSSFLQLLRAVRNDPFMEIVPPAWEAMNRGIDLFERRPDKDWSLTDCISFVVMQERGVKEALTADHHFEQAGFIALLK